MKYIIFLYNIYFSLPKNIYYMLILTIYDKFTLLYSFSNLPYIKNVCWCAATEYFSGRLVGIGMEKYLSTVHFL